MRAHIDECNVRIQRTHPTYLFTCRSSRCRSPNGSSASLPSPASYSVRTRRHPTGGTSAKTRCSAQSVVSTYEYLPTCLLTVGTLTHVPTTYPLLIHSLPSLPAQVLLKVLGMWVHMSPFAITALHWGWDKIHDLCFTCKDTSPRLWNPTPTPTPNPNPKPNPNLTPT